MLTTLRIKNLALVPDLTLELQPGCNVITGETGAGKSIIIGALNLVLGERADRLLIRTGSDSCSVEAVFDVAQLCANQRGAPASGTARRGSDLKHAGSETGAPRLLAQSCATSKTASTEQLSLPVRISERSARSPRTRLSAPMMMDLPTPVSPVMTLQPG